MKAFIKNGFVYVKKDKSETTFFGTIQRKYDYKIVIEDGELVGIKFKTCELDETLMKLAFLDPEEIGTRDKYEIEDKIKFKSSLISALIPLQREL